MQTKTISWARMQSPTANAARWATVIATAAALAACGTPGVAAATPGGSAHDPRTLTYYSLSTWPDAPPTGDSSRPPAPTSRSCHGDELIINDQLTTTRQVNGGYPIVGH